jgi:gamma-glutamylcyclotransferase (GGCT)/AIG2-like uncharacterized protein YtfP
MTLHFAYGSNMSRTLMQPRCPGATALGPAQLHGFRFFVMREGYASVAPAAGEIVHGVLWWLTARDIAALNAYENIESGLYSRAMFPVRHREATRRALVYLGRSRGEGTPRPGYMEFVVAAAREWALPEDYTADLARWQPSGWRGARPPETGEA